MLSLPKHLTKGYGSCNPKIIHKKYSTLLQGRSTMFLVIQLIGICLHRYNLSNKGDKSCQYHAVSSSEIR
jgi:hypothetical protein